MLRKVYIKFKVLLQKKQRVFSISLSEKTNFPLLKENCLAIDF